MSTDLRRRLDDPGFTPRERDFDALCELLAEKDREVAERAERALARAGKIAAAHAQRRFETASPRERARLVNVISRVALKDPEPQLVQTLLQALDDVDPKTRRNAIIALGKTTATPDLETRLLALWDAAPVEHRRSLAEALGKVGGSKSLEFLSGVRTNDKELARLMSRATLMLSRTAHREKVAKIRLDQALPHKLRCVFHCRPGLARILAAEVNEFTACEIRNQEYVGFEWSGSAGELLRVRTALDFGIVIPRLAANSDEESVAQTLLSARVLEALNAWTHGTPTFRLDFVESGHRRATVWRIAEHVAAQSSALINDPTRAAWEILVAETQLLLVPRAYEDPRFAYRQADVPAASHPTLAAALARASEVDPNDAVWDPFVGSALELIERARLGPYRSLHGTDLEDSALGAARINLKAAGLSAKLAQTDALIYHPQGITLIVTNPPMGRRVARDGSIAPLLENFVRHAYRVLTPGGRLVWLSPLASRTASAAKSAGFRVERLENIDMGGFDAELQILRKRS